MENKINYYSKKMYEKQMKELLKTNGFLYPKITMPKLKWYQKILQFLHIKDYRIIEYSKINEIKCSGKPTIKIGGKDNEKNS